MTLSRVPPPADIPALAASGTPVALPSSAPWAPELANVLLEHGGAVAVDLAGWSATDARALCRRIRVLQAFARVAVRDAAFSTPSTLDALRAARRTGVRDLEVTGTDPVVTAWRAAVLEAAWNLPSSAVRAGAGDPTLTLGTVDGHRRSSRLGAGSDDGNASPVAPRVWGCFEARLAGAGSGGDEGSPWRALRAETDSRHVLASLGWARTDGDETAPAITPVQAGASPSVPRFEVLAYEAGWKPLLYLTVPIAERAAWCARFDGHARGEVPYVLAHDTVRDIRARSAASLETATHVDLFFSRDPTLAARAEEIYRDPVGPTRSLAEMGAMLGYPSCCVAAFQCLADRANNTATRYEAHARTQRLGWSFDPLLDNLHAVVTPFFPCSYACAEGVALARPVLDRWAQEAPADAALLRARLAEPVFFVDAERAVSLVGARSAPSGSGSMRIAYRGVRSLGGRRAPHVEAFEAALVPVLASGDTVEMDGGGWSVWQGVMLRARFEPSIVHPFGRWFPFLAADALDAPRGG